MKGIQVKYCETQFFCACKFPQDIVIIIPFTILAIIKLFLLNASFFIFYLFPKLVAHNIRSGRNSLVEGAKIK